MFEGIMDLLKGRGKDLKGYGKNLKEGAVTVSALAKQRVKLEGLNRSLNGKYERLGREFYELVKSEEGYQDILPGLVEDVTIARGEIDDLQEQIAALKKELKAAGKPADDDWDDFDFDDIEEPAAEEATEECCCEEKAEEAPAEECCCEEKAAEAPAEECCCEEKAAEAPAEECCAEEKPAEETAGECCCETEQAADPAGE